jgi:hypothetical protein
MTPFHQTIVSLLLRSGWIVCRMRLDDENCLLILADRGDYCVSGELAGSAIVSLEWQWRFAHEWHQATDFADILALPIHTPPVAFPYVF